MDPATYDSLPAFLEMRELEVTVREPGVRTRTLIVATTFTDAQEFPAEEIAWLYRARWQVELDIRAIKTTLGMDILRAKSPAMARKEAWSCLLAYNLIRQTLLRSAQQSGATPRALSFTAALQATAAAYLPSLLMDEAVLAELWRIAAEHPVGDRPGRVEPRAVKRRAKPHALLTKPRKQARQELLAPKP